MAIPAFAPAGAQNSAPSAAVYNVSDVAVDVTADSAAKARDLAIQQAQRTALGQLIERVGADPNVAAKLSNDDIATLVQNFEVSGERASSIRYIGTFTVQFRPQAVRNFLNMKGTAYNDAQGKTALIIPVVHNGDKFLCGPDAGRWQKLWTDAARGGGLVPLIVAAGTPDDAAILPPADAATGKVGAIKALMDKYKTDAAIVAVLEGQPDAPDAGYQISYQHFGAAYDDGSDIEHITAAPNNDKIAAANILSSNLRQIRQRLEKEWKRPPSESMTSSQDNQSPGVSITSELPGMTPEYSDSPGTSHLTITANFETLQQWTNIQRRLTATAGVRRVDVTSLDRGDAEIDLGYTGTPQDLQVAMAQRGLRLTQDILSGRWFLKGL